jgi:hypothetical protein
MVDPFRTSRLTIFYEFRDIRFGFPDDDGIKVFKAVLRVEACVTASGYGLHPSLSENGGKHLGMFVMGVKV